MAYRTMRWLLRKTQLFWSEFSDSPGKAIIEVLLEAPAALLVIDPYRQFVIGHPALWWVILGAAFGGIVFGASRRYRIRRACAATVVGFMPHMTAIQQFCRKHTKEHEKGARASKADIRNTVELVLEAFCNLTRHLLRLPREVRIYANLMIPMPVYVEGSNQQWDGCGIVAYNQTRPPDPAWTRLVLADLGAGAAFADGQVQVVEDTRDPAWCGVFERFRARSFVSLPVKDSSNKIVAVVNIDSMRPATFTRRLVHDELYPAIAVALDLLGDILYNTRNGAEGESDATQPSIQESAESAED